MNARHAGWPRRTTEDGRAAAEEEATGESTENSDSGDAIVSLYCTCLCVFWRGKQSQVGSSGDGMWSWVLVDGVGTGDGGGGGVGVKWTKVKEFCAEKHWPSCHLLHATRIRRIPYYFTPSTPLCFGVNQLPSFPHQEAPPPPPHPPPHPPSSGNQTFKTMTFTPFERAKNPMSKYSRVQMVTPMLYFTKYYSFK